MRFSLSWLAEFVQPVPDAEQLAQILTMAGIEVESWSKLAPEFSGVVVGQIKAVSAHPQADRLRLCQVDVAEALPLSIVCGASNVAVGMKVACARVGAVLPHITIRAAKLRGVDSYGMLCAGQELGMPATEGLLVLPEWASVGEDVRSTLHLDDIWFDCKITPNRGDCLGVYGLAREVAALTGARLLKPQTPQISPSLTDTLAVQIQDKTLCGRFCGRVIRGINAAAPTPHWMAQRLMHAGYRAHSVLVDISNYLMLTFNSPNHIFDLHQLQGPLVVRWSTAGEKVALLNGQTVELDNRTGVIADAQGIQAIAGVMGSQSSAVSTSSKDIFIEVAFWWPDAVRGRARDYGLVSEAAYRFERGVDAATCADYLEHLTALIVQCCAGEVAVLTEQILDVPQSASIHLRLPRLQRVLGVEVTAHEVETVLGRLHFSLQPHSNFKSEVQGGGFDQATRHTAFGRRGASKEANKVERLIGDWNQEGQAWQVQVPSYRFDLSIEEDLIEEFARIWGYERIPAQAARMTAHFLPQAETHRSIWSCRHLLAARDYQEVINYAFSSQAIEREQLANERIVYLENPMAQQWSALRSSLMPGLVKNLQDNLSRQLTRVRIFEWGHCFFQSACASATQPYTEKPMLAALIAGNVAPTQWGSACRNADFYDLKADLEALFAPASLRYCAAQQAFLHPGATAHVYLGDACIGTIGVLHPKWVRAYGLKVEPVLFELDAAAVLASHLPRHRSVSPLPWVLRDLAFVVPESITLQIFMDALWQVATPIVRHIELFDVYRGAGVPEGHKSFALGIALQAADKTLSEADISSVLQVLIEQAQNTLGASLRQQ